MNKRAKIFIILPILLMFLSSTATQEALAQPPVTFEIEVEVVTGPPRDNCPPANDPVDGASVTVAVSFPSVSGANLTVPTATVSGTTSGGIYTATGSIAVGYPSGALRARPQILINPDAWNITASVSGCPPGYSPAPASRTVTAHSVTGSVSTGLHVKGRVLLFCRCTTRPPATAALTLPRDKAVVMASVAVKEEEKVQVAQEISGQVVATVMVNDEPRDFTGPDKSIPVNPGDYIELVGTLGHTLAYFAFAPKEEKAPPPAKPPVVECPKGQPTVVSVPGSYTDTPIESMAVTTGPVTTGQEAPPAVAVTPPKGEVVLAPGPEEIPALEPVLKTSDAVIAAGQLDNSAIGSNAISVIDKTTGAVLGQAQIDMWRLAGASLDPPVVNKGQDTNLRLNVFGPPDLQLEVTATAGEGLTPKQLTATAPISVLQKEGLGAFTATKPGTHSVSVKAVPVTQVVQKGEEAGKSHPREPLLHEEMVEEARRLMDKWENFEELTPEERNLLSQVLESLESRFRALILSPEEALLRRRGLEMKQKELWARMVEEGRATGMTPEAQNYSRLFCKFRKAADDFNSARRSGDRAAMERARQEVERLQRSLEYLELTPENRAELERKAARLLERMDVELGQ